MAENKDGIPEDPDKTVVIPDNDDGKTIVLSPDALNSIKPAKSAEKTEFFSCTWFRGSRDVNTLIHAEKQAKLGSETPISVPKTDNTDPELIANDLLYLKKRDFNGGGQGILSEQFDLALGRTVAVKSLRKELLDKQESRATFIREAKISARLEHPSIIPIYSLTGDAEKGLHLAMKLISGMSLSDYLKEICSHYEKEGLKNYNEGKTLLYRLDLFLRICDALAYAHSRNIMHRDLKPENIILGKFREIYVMDWGIAQHIVAEADEPEKPGTGKKTLWGTPVFMSPELLRGEGGDQRADIYALGMILFEMVYLKPGIKGSSLPEILGKAKNSQFESFRHRFGFPVSSELTAIIRKAVHPDLAQRYQSVDAFSQDLRRFLAGEETKAKPDHLPGKILRLISRHRKTAALLIVLLILGFITELAYSFYKQRNEEIFRRRYDHALTQITANADTTAYEIEQKIISLGTFLQLVCEEMTVRLNNPAEPCTYRPVPFMKKGGKAAGAIYSPFYKSLLNLDRFGMYIAPDGADAAAAQQQVVKLAPILEKSADRFWRAAISDISATTGEKKKIFAQQGGAMVWFYVGMESGLYLQYPSSDALPEGYDPRKRPWYLTGFSNASERLIWSKPYHSAQTGWLMMTGTRSCRRGGKTIGVAGFDVSLAYFAKLIDRYGTNPRYTRGKYILDDDGTILVAGDRDSDSVWGGSHLIAEKINADTMLNVKNMDTGRIFEKIRLQKSGIITQKKGNETLLYVFFPIRIRNWSYVEVVSINAYLSGGVEELRSAGPAAN